MGCYIQSTESKGGETLLKVLYSTKLSSGNEGEIKSSNREAKTKGIYHH